MLCRSARVITCSQSSCSRLWLIITPLAHLTANGKLRRDATGNSASKNFRGLFAALRRGQAEARYILAVNVVMLGAK